MNRNEDTPTIPLSRKCCLTLEMIRNLDRELRIPVDKCRPTLPTLIAALFYDLSTDKEIKIRYIRLTQSYPALYKAGL
ncbi:hypothetical protein [Microcoleus sp. CZ3-B4]|uniref:hypothetical protein n=1 Tax=Microcoleus sp. CZ3-B4 TaxID=2818733 RepID=UPI002FD3F012